MPAVATYIHQSKLDRVGRSLDLTNSLGIEFFLFVEDSNALDFTSQNAVVVQTNLFDIQTSLWNRKEELRLPESESLDDLLVGLSKPFLMKEALSLSLVAKQVLWIDIDVLLTTPLASLQTLCNFRFHGMYMPGTKFPAISEYFDMFGEQKNTVQGSLIASDPHHVHRLCDDFAVAIRDMVKNRRVAWDVNVLAQRMSKSDNYITWIHCKRKGYCMIKNTIKYFEDQKNFADISDETIFENCKEYTSSSYCRLKWTIDTTQSILDANIKGHMVEIGVGGGGHAMAMMCKVLQNGLDERSKTVVAIDTFKGMLEGHMSEYDVEEETGLHGSFIYNLIRNKVAVNCFLRNVIAIPFPRHLLRIIQADVTKFVPDMEVSFLKIDVLQYEVIKRCLEDWKGFVKSRGYICCDSYGSWCGARKACEDFLDRPWQQIDYTAHYYEV